jgi:tRNA(Ile2) C34 agmatinyltransferase TiaS
MTPQCPACDKPMKEDGRAFLCEQCRQIIIFFDVSDASRYLAGKAIPVCRARLI